MAAPAGETLYLIDAHSLIYQVFHAIVRMTSPDGLPTNAVFGFTRDLIYLRNEKKPGYLICVFDVAGPTFRDKIAADYKAHRKPMDDDLQLQIPMIHEVLDAMRVPTLGVEGFEADDVIATLACEGAERGMNVFICSSDKDMRQLINDRVNIFNLRKRQVFDCDELLKDWGIRPEQVIDYQTLVGDSVDNVKGVPGIGPKTACQMLQQFQTLENLLANIAEIKGKKREALEASADIIKVSRQLVRLDSAVPMDLNWDAWRVQPWDGPKLVDLFRGWGFRTFIDQLRASMPSPEPQPEPKERQVQRARCSTNKRAKPPASSRPAGRRRTTSSTRRSFLRRFFSSFVNNRVSPSIWRRPVSTRRAELVGLAFSCAAARPTISRFVDLPATRHLTPIRRWRCSSRFWKTQPSARSIRTSSTTGKCCANMASTCKAWSATPWWRIICCTPANAVMAWTSWRKAFAASRYSHFRPDRQGQAATMHGPGADRRCGGVRRRRRRRRLAAV